MRPVPLTVVKGGINRLKIKGGASATSLYDLTNAYVTQAGTIVPREGTLRSATLTNQSAGLMAFDGIINVFSNTLITVPGGYQDNLLIDPSDPTATIVKIWFAKPFLGFPYVVAQFSNGHIIHFWLQTNGTWQANHVYFNGNIITPNTPNGLAYMAQRIQAPNSVWSPQTAITAGTVVEPTAYNGYMFRAVSVLGSAPHTGSTEPTWPTVKGAVLQEFGDFDTSSSDAGTTNPSTGSGAQPLGGNITDRYGNSSVIAGQTGQTTASSAPSVAAAQTVTVWAAGTTYAPGAVVQPSTGQGAFINAIPNGDFEAGNDGNWTLSNADVTFSNTGQYQGNFCVKFALNHDTQTATMFNFGTVTVGQSVTASAYLNPNNSGSDMTMNILLNWYDSSDTFLSSTVSAGQQGGGYRPVSVTGNAPAGAAHCRVAIKSATGTNPNPSFVDLVTWNLETAAAVSNFLFEAVQSAPATSGSTEPSWPTVAGHTVIDGGVTWEAIGTSIITWQAIPLMQSGPTEPTFPTTLGNSVHDGSSFTSTDAHVTDTSMSWVAINRQISDINNPQTKVVALGASHVFAGDKDIVPFSAAVDPTDWTTTNNAGYLPTGLNNYGDNPVSVLALYRSNLVAFNAGGYQMWQIDPDPANMALLDAEPIGSIYTQSWQSVANDLIGLTEVGVRNIGTVGATANLQIGNTGQPVDPMVKQQIVNGLWPNPISLYYPGRGQYWLFFGAQAFVLTMNGTNQKTWSRYLFPDVITDWTLNGGTLLLRTAGNLVWAFDYETLVDDAGGANTAFTSTIQWPYLDAGSYGINKFLVGVDLTGYGVATIQVAFQQQDVTTFSDNPGFATSLNVTAPYTVNPVDTVPGEPLPIPINAPSYSLILSFNSNQPSVNAPNSPSWEWEAANFYLTDQAGGGATG